MAATNGGNDGTIIDGENDENELAKKMGPKEAYEYTKSVLLGKEIKCTLSDGRNLTGKLICIDRLKNLILTNVTETRYIDPLDYKYCVNKSGTDDNAIVNNNDNNHNNDNNAVDNDGDIRNNDTTTKAVRLISQAMINGKTLVKVEIDTNKLK